MKTIQWKHEPLFKDDAGLFWYLADDGGIAFVAPLAKILTAHLMEPAVGPHGFADVTEVRGIDTRPAMRPAVVEVAEGSTDLDVGLVVNEWMQFCDAAFEAVDADDEEGDGAAAKSDRLVEPGERVARVRAVALKTWAYDDAAEVEKVLVADKCEQLVEEMAGLDSRALARVLATARTIRSARMLATN